MVLPQLASEPNKAYTKENNMFSNNFVTNLAAKLVFTKYVGSLKIVNIS